MNDSRLLIMHVVFRFDVGGLENGIVNLINHMPAERYRHVIVALTECVPSFCARIRNREVVFLSLHKGDGHGFRLYPELYRLFRQYRPAVVHTRNLAALEAVVPAWLARVPVRIHGEHGWDSFDPDGRVARYQVLRRLYAPFVSGYVALSRRIENYLLDKVRIKASRIRRICNGVDARRFAPVTERQPVAGSPFNSGGLLVFGAVGRLQKVKDHATLIRAFAEFLQRCPDARATARLVIVGGGPLRDELEGLVGRLELADLVWLAGERSDIPEINAGLDVFVLPSLGEGISNTLLEAMASGLPVIATDVGGNGELVVAGETGLLVPSADPGAMAQALLLLFRDREMLESMGRKGRARVVDLFSLDAMVSAYINCYEDTLTHAA
ncbi:TIGR03088 family PEP-CTERM/XrtA system glycosyltransferase [Zoogloea sp.]|uniref:TIGR03088 family PEP-CTERM/XrtA system glycosyltransferase n=1 Tax=Zoogloea sp. TaxID=49181 RepID=UPI002609CE46|nr:TIGR03088 family PEP-CTERM/XrtA system glycosyltransferase [Zoogloea sp.]MDD3352540.1 TIGR03088 family PEP-CTERM/XrtA system glycosyltransferase [Zoogloea sp.]